MLPISPDYVNFEHPSLPFYRNQCDFTAELEVSSRDFDTPVVQCGYAANASSIGFIPAAGRIDSSTKKIRFYLPLRGCYGGRSRGQPKTAQNLLNRRRRVYRTQNSHPSPTARTDKDIQLEHPHHQLSPGMVFRPASPHWMPSSKSRGFPDACRTLSMRHF